jgi:hypothetical protein
MKSMGDIVLCFQWNAIFPGWTATTAVSVTAEKSLSPVLSPTDY